MVGFDPSAKWKLSKTEYAIAGGVSGAVTRGLCQPLDVIKIRFQLQVEPLSRSCPESKYWGVIQATRHIVKEEGPAALWKGHVPAQMLSVVYGFAQFLSFEVLTRHAWHVAPETNQPLVHFVCGTAAGCIATLVSFPCDVVRTRLVAQGEPKVYRDVSHAFISIYSREGFKAFFKGLSPTLVQVGPHTGAQFTFYTLFKNIWKDLVAANRGLNESELVIGSLVSGSLAGLCSKTLVYPMDLARKRMQVQGFEQARQQFGKVFKCQGLVNCIWLTAREEKLTGLFKGLFPSLLKAAATTALHFSVYEQICRLLASFHE